MKLNVYSVRSFNVLKNGTRADQVTTKVAAENDAVAFEVHKLNVLTTDGQVAEVHAVAVESVASDVLVDVDAETESLSKLTDSYTKGVQDGERDTLAQIDTATAKAFDDGYAKAESEYGLKLTEEKQASYESGKAEGILEGYTKAAAAAAASVPPAPSPETANSANEAQAPAVGIAGDGATANESGIDAAPVAAQ